jgi:transposase
MAPSTRSVQRDNTPDNPPKAIEADTLKRKRFFDAYDNREPGQSTRSIERRFRINYSTAQYWLTQRDTLGSPAYRRTRKRFKNLGRKPKVSKEEIQTLVLPSKNPVRDQCYKAQIKYYNLNIVPRTIQRRLKQDTNQGQRYKQAYIRKTISKKNREERVKYRYQYQDKSIEDFWQFVLFSDEAHIDPTSTIQGYILREAGTRYNSENIQERGEKKGVVLHVATWINWNGKAEKLEFYNNENDYIQRPKRPPKPRKTMYKSAEEFQYCLDKWDTSLPHKQEVKPKGNAITQKYYCKRLLPIYIKAIHKARLQDPQSWLFQEDGDPSYGLRKKGLAYHLKEAN